MTPDELRVAFERLPVVPPDATAWLSAARPSQAFLLCICSGPWVYARRHQVQQRALDVLDAHDLTAVPVSEFAFPLAWQSAQYEKAASVSPRPFDSIFLRRCLAPNAASDVRLEALRVFDAVFGDIFQVPKVIGLFVRDYLEGSCFPVDRHVRAWLAARNVHSVPQALRLCREAGIDPGALSRAVFASVSKNPTDLRLPA